MTNKIKEEKCKNCELARIKNFRYPLCPYHFGIEQGKLQTLSEVEKMIKIFPFGEYAGEDLGEALRNDLINELKSKIKEIKNEKQD